MSNMYLLKRLYELDDMKDLLLERDRKVYCNDVELCTIYGDNFVVSKDLLISSFDVCRLSPNYDAIYSIFDSKLRDKIYHFVIQFIHESIYSGKYSCITGFFWNPSDATFYKNSQLMDEDFSDWGVESILFDSEGKPTHFTLSGCEHTVLSIGYLWYVRQIFEITGKTVQHNLLHHFDWFIENNNIYPTTPVNYKYPYAGNSKFPNTFPWQALEVNDRGCFFYDLPILYQVLFFLSLKGDRLGNIENDAIDLFENSVSFEGLVDYVRDSYDLVKLIAGGNLDDYKDIADMMSMYKEFGCDTSEGKAILLDMPRTSCDGIIIPACTFLIPFYLDVQNESIKCYPRESHIVFTSDGDDHFFHPHISSGGVCCLPNIDNMIVELCAFGDFGSAYNQLLHFLQTHRYSQAYDGWQKFTDEDINNIIKDTENYYGSTPEPMPIRTPHKVRRSDVN